MMTDAVRSPLRQLAASAASLGALNVVGMGITFLVGILLARQLGPGGYGIYALAMSVTALGGMITEFGLPALVMREVAAGQARSDWADARGLSLWADKMVLAMFALLAIIFGAWWWGWARHSSSEFVATLGWSICLIPVVALAKLRGLALLSFGRTIAGQLPVLVLRPGLFAVLLAIAWFMWPGALSPAQAMMFQVMGALLALAAVTIGYVRYRPAAFAASAKRYAPRAWLASCLPMAATEGLRLLQGQTALLLLGLFSTTSAAGLYRVADATIAICTVAWSVLATATAPIFAKLFVEKDMRSLSDVLVLVSVASAGSIFAMGLPIALLGSQAFEFAFGGGFGASAAVFVILWVGNIASASMGAITTYANMTGGERQVAAGSLVSMVVSVIISGVLIPIWHERGAAIGTAVGMVVWNGYVLIQMRKRVAMSYSAAGLRLARLAPAMAIVRARFGSVPPAADTDDLPIDLGGPAVRQARDAI